MTRKACVDNVAVGLQLSLIYPFTFVMGSNPTEALGNFGNFLYPALPVSFGRETKSRWSLLSGVYARGS